MKLGRVAGVALGVHWSVLIVAALIAQSLAMSVLPTGAPGRAAATYWAVAILAVLIFFAALLAHELAHALTARHYRVRVRSSTLWLLGGVTQLEGQTPNARADLAIALAGPLTSVGAATALGALAVIAGMLAADNVLVTALVWLTLINAVLVLFNLLPGAPLDGGRVLAAAVGWATGNRATGHRVAARSGILLGSLLIGGGAAVILLAGAWDGIWLMLLGWFLIAAANAEARDAMAKDDLGGIYIRDVMTSPAISGYAQHTVDMFITAVASRHPHNSYPVLGLDGLLTGMVSTGRLAAVAPNNRAVVRLGAVQVPREQLTVTSPQTPLSDVVRELQSAGQRLAVVCVEGHVCGVASLADVVHAFDLAALGVKPQRHSAYAP